MKQETRVVRAGREKGYFKGCVNPPVYHVSTVLHDSLASFLSVSKPEQGRMIYGRWGTPTSFTLPMRWPSSKAAPAARCFPPVQRPSPPRCWPSCEPGDHLLIPDNVYGSTRRICDDLLPRFQVETTYYDPTIGGGIASLIRPKTKIVYVEAPGSLTMEMQDVPAIAKAAKAAGAITMMDNTWATPLFFRPFDHGVDVSITAGTKYIVGHSDAMVGSVTATPEGLARHRARSAICWANASAPTMPISPSAACARWPCGWRAIRNRRSRSPNGSSSSRRSSASSIPRCRRIRAMPCGSAILPAPRACSPSSSSRSR